MSIDSVRADLLLLEGKVRKSGSSGDRQTVQAVLEGFTGGTPNTLNSTVRRAQRVKELIDRSPDPKSIGETVQKCISRWEKYVSCFFCGTCDAGFQLRIRMPTSDNTNGNGLREHRPKPNGSKRRGPARRIGVRSAAM